MNTSSEIDPGSFVENQDRPENVPCTIEQRFLSCTDYQAMAHDLPLIKRTIGRHALTLYATVLIQGKKMPELGNVAELGTRAAIAVREFCQAMEGISRRRYPKALWLQGYAEIDEEQDQFEWLPQIVKVRKSITPPTGATTE